MSDELIDFLRERLDETEKIARDVQPSRELTPSDPIEFILAGQDVTTPATWAAERHIKSHDPARTLVEVEAMRRVLDLHHFIELPTEMLDACATCEVTGKYPEYPCATLRLLALPYASHPDYRKEWRP